MRTNKYKFLKSAFTEKNEFISTKEVIKWLKERNRNVSVNVEKIKFEEMENWILDEKYGVIKHKTGKFFSIVGIEVFTNWGKVNQWKQPIINQPEIGYLGIITKEFNGVLYFLLQAKVEPGNVNNIQLSPTLQATKSNYTQVHKGRKPLYLEYFQSVSKENVLLDQLQSEQGARFLKKRNRNIIINVNENIIVHDDFIWLTLGQIKELIKYDNLVNMDTRTVISGIPFGSFDATAIDFFFSLNSGYNLGSEFSRAMLFSAVTNNQQLNSFDDILNWMTYLKCKYELEVSSVSLFDIDEWSIEKDMIRHKEDKFFKVIAARVNISSREVINWDQPLVEPAQQGLIAFITKKINGIYHFLVQAKLECGNYDILEMAPTVQCLTGSYHGVKDLPFLQYVLNAGEDQIKYDTLQSEEGGRFYREQNRNLIIEADDNFPIKVPENYIWLTLNQLLIFLKFNNYLNIQARSLISAISFM